MITFPSKQPHVQTTIFTKMSALALEHGALNLSQGFPGFDCAPALQELLQHYSKGYNQYAPMAGVPVFRQSLAEKTSSFYGIPVDADSEVTIVSGATEALFAAVHCCVSPGDEVIIFGDPAAGVSSADDLAVACDTINYEIVTRMGGRFKRHYLGSVE